MSVCGVRCRRDATGHDETGQDTMGVTDSPTHRLTDSPMAHGNANLHVRSIFHFLSSRIFSLLVKDAFADPGLTFSVSVIGGVWSQLAESSAASQSEGAVLAMVCSIFFFAGFDVLSGLRTQDLQFFVCAQAVPCFSASQCGLDTRCGTQAGRCRIFVDGAEALKVYGLLDQVQVLTSHSHLPLPSHFSSLIFVAGGRTQHSTALVTSRQGLPAGLVWVWIRIRIRVLLWIWVWKCDDTVW